MTKTNRKKNLLQMNEEYKEKRRRNIMAKELHEEFDGKFRPKVIPKGRNKKKLRPVDILNLTEEELDTLYDN